MRDVKDKNQVRILDIGCGTGELVTSHLGSLGASVLGIDLHLPSIERAWMKNTFDNVEFECVSIDKLADRRFYVIICSELLEHLDDPSKMLNLVSGMLKEAGICIITIPNGYGPKEMENRLYQLLYGLLSRLKLIGTLRSLLRFLISKRRAGWTREVESEDSIVQDTLNAESPHIQFFTLRRFKSLLNKCGLSIVKMENRRFLSGPFSGTIIDRSKRLIDWHIKVATMLPPCLVSSWMFVVKYREDN